MGIQETPADAPDTFGLPEYYVSCMRAEIVGNDIRFVLGTKRFGVVHWVCTLIVPADAALKMSTATTELAQEVYNLAQMVPGLTH